MLAWRCTVQWVWTSGPSNLSHSGGHFSGTARHEIPPAEPLPYCCYSQDLCSAASQQPLCRRHIGPSEYKGIATACPGPAGLVSCEPRLVSVERKNIKLINKTQDIDAQ